MVGRTHDVVSREYLCTPGTQSLLLFPITKDQRVIRRFGMGHNTTTT